MTLKEKFLSLKTDEEYRERMREFDDLPYDKDIANHLRKICKKRKIGYDPKTETITEAF